MRETPDMRCPNCGKMVRTREPEPVFELQGPTLILRGHRDRYGWQRCPGSGFRMDRPKEETKVD